MASVCTSSTYQTKKLAGDSTIGLSKWQVYVLVVLIRPIKWLEILKLVWPVKWQEMKDRSSQLANVCTSSTNQTNQSDWKYYTPWTRGGPGGLDQTPAIKSRKN